MITLDNLRGTNLDSLFNQCLEAIKSGTDQRQILNLIRMVNFFSSEKAKELYKEIKQPNG